MYASNPIPRDGSSKDFGLVLNSVVIVHVYRLLLIVFCVDLHLLFMYSNRSSCVCVVQIQSVICMDVFGIVLPKLM